MAPAILPLTCIISLWSGSIHLWYTHWDEGRVTRALREEVFREATLIQSFKSFCGCFCNNFTEFFLSSSDFAPSCSKFTSFTEFFAFKSVSKFAVTFFLCVPFRLELNNKHQHFHVFHTYTWGGGLWSTRHNGIRGKGTVCWCFKWRFLVGFEEIFQALRNFSFNFRTRDVFQD